VAPVSGRHAALYVTLFALLAVLLAYLATR
jgi:hypothetical protein